MRRSPTCRCRWTSSRNTRSLGAVVLSGGTSPALEELCSANRLELVDYYAGEELTLKNALLTAEGALSLLISGSERGAVRQRGGYNGIRQDSAVSGANARIVPRPGNCDRPGPGAAAGGSSGRLLRAPGGACRTCGRQRGSHHQHGPGAAAYRGGFRENAPRGGIPGACHPELSPRKGMGAIRRGGLHQRRRLPGKYSPRTAGEAIANAVTAALRHRE